MWFVLMKCPVSDNISNLAAGQKITNNTWNSPASLGDFVTPGETDIMQILLEWIEKIRSKNYTDYKAFVMTWRQLSAEILL